MKKKQVNRKVYFVLIIILVFVFNSLFIMKINTKGLAIKANNIEKIEILEPFKETIVKTYLDKEQISKFIYIFNSLTLSVSEPFYDCQRMSEKIKIYYNDGGVDFISYNFTSINYNDLFYRIDDSNSSIITTEYDKFVYGKGTDETLENTIINEEFDVSLKREKVIRDAKYSLINSIYSITPKIMTYKNNSFIIYPYINIFGYYEKEQQLNDLIQKYLLFSNNNVNKFFTYDENSPLKTAEDVGTYLDYEIIYANDELVSILFHGECVQDFIKSKYDDFNILKYMSDELDKDNEGGISPAFTINVNTGKEVVLSDIIPMNRNWKIVCEVENLLITQIKEQLIIPRF